MAAPTRVREGAPAPDSGPLTAARTAKTLRTRPADARSGSTLDPALGNAAVARAARAVQPKLAVSQVDDPLEREAEAVSARVVSRAPLREATPGSGPAGPASRKPVGRQAESAATIIGRLAGPAVRTVARDDATPTAPAAPAAAGPEVAPGSGGPEVSADLESFITGISGGDPLAAELRAKIEPVLGADLSAVRVHSDDRSAAAAAKLQARAFTFGKDIFLAAGESPADLALMAHESTHAVQQGAVEVFRLFEFVTDAASEAVASAARGIPGYLMVSQIIGKDPISGAPVTTGRAEFVQALLGYGPFAGAVGPVLSAMDALDDIFTLISNRLGEHNLSLDRVIGDMTRAWQEVDLVQGVEFNIAIVTRYVDALLNDVRAFITAIVADVIAAVRAAAVKFAEPLVQSPTVKPYWDLGTKVFHYDPLKGEDVNVPTVEILGDFLKLIGKADVMEQMQTRGTLQQTADWLDAQFDTFKGLLGQAKQLFADAWTAISPENLPNLVSNIESLAQRAYTLLQDVGAFAQTVITKVLELVKHSLLGMLSEHAKHTRGFTLLTVILGKDPFTDEHVDRNAENLIKGFITLLPNGEQMYSQLAESGVIGDAAGRIENEMTRLNISWELITGTFKAIWDGLQLTDLLDPIGAFIRIVDQFGEPLGRIIEFVATVLQVVIELILKLMNFPSALLGKIIDNAMAAIEDIKRDPIQFLKNVIEAIKQGVQGFFSNVGAYLLQGLEDWLFRGLRSLGITPPTTISVEAIITLVIQVSGVTEETLWKKLGDRIGPERVVQIRGALDQLGQAWAFIKDVQERGITAVWEFIQGQLSNLWDTILSTAKDWIMKEVVEKVATRLLSMLDPTGVMAVVRSAQAFFNAIQSAIEYIREILEIVDRYVSTLAAVARGDVGPGADMLEHGLADSIPVAIGFLANQIGMGDVPEQIRDIIVDLRHLIYEALDWLFDQAMALGRAALDALGLGDNANTAAPALVINKDLAAENTNAPEQHHLVNDGPNGELMIHSATTPVTSVTDVIVLQLHADFVAARAVYLAEAAKKPPEEAKLAASQAAVDVIADQIVARLKLIGLAGQPDAELNLPNAKGHLLVLYRQHLTELHHVPGRGRDTAQVSKWVSSVKGEISDAQYDRAVHLGLLDEPGDSVTDPPSHNEKFLRAKLQDSVVFRPTWSRTQRYGAKMQVDHVIEWQVFPTGAVDEPWNFMLLDPSSNASSGASLAPSIAATRATLPPYWQDKPIYFTSVAAPSGGSPGETWTHDEIAAGEHLDVYEEKWKS